MTPSTTEGLLREALLELLGQFDQAHSALCVDRSPSAQEAIAKAQQALATPASPVQGLPNLAQPLASLLNMVNAVTAPHRHGMKVSASALDNLANRQIEVEKVFREYWAALAALNKEGEAQPPAVMDYDSCIRALAPFLPDGWVAQDKDGETTNLFKMKPGMDEWAWTCLDSENETSLYPFTIPRAADWRSSLRHVVGGKVVVEG